MDDLKEKLITEATKCLSTHKPQANVHFNLKIDFNSLPDLSLCSDQLPSSFDIVATCSLPL